MVAAISQGFSNAAMLIKTNVNQSIKIYQQSRKIYINTDDLKGNLNGRQSMPYLFYLTRVLQTRYRMDQPRV